MANAQATAKPKAAIPPKPEKAPGEKVDKAKKFVELGEKRMVKAIKSIRLLANLANYNYTAAQLDAIQGALHNEVVTVIKRLEQGLQKKNGKRGDVSFKL
jgi:hypothetical protein